VAPFVLGDEQRDDEQVRRWVHRRGPFCPAVDVFRLAIRRQQFIGQLLKSLFNPVSVEAS
jgi:hypothetical protein